METLDSAEIFENLYSPATDSCVRLQERLGGEDGGREWAVKRVYIFLCPAANRSERWGGRGRSTKLAGQRHSGQIVLNKFIFIPSPLGFYLLGHLCVRIISHSIKSALWLVAQWNNPVGGEENETENSSTTLFFFKYNGLGNEPRKQCCLRNPSCLNSHMPRSPL